MIRWFRNWRARRRETFCAYVQMLGAQAYEDLRERLWAECEAELLAEIGDEWKRTKCEHVGKVGYFKGGAWVCQCEERR